jgi:preprotein translocase subunit SecA
VLSKLLRLGEGRMVKRLKGVADYVNTLSDDIEKLSDAELRAKTDEFKKRVADGADLDDGRRGAALRQRRRDEDR